MEEQWFKKSTGKMNYITIDENNLDNVLNNKPIEKTKVQSL